MRRFALPVAVLALLASATSAGAAQNAWLVECGSALGQADRFAEFKGRMRAIPGAERLLMRFTLQMRDEGSPRWRALPPLVLGRWMSSDPAVSRYVYTKRVENLVAPAGYRAVVRFRWLDERGRRLAAGRAVSPACLQADLRPNLHPLDIRVQRGPAAARATYVIPVANRGRTAVDAFELVLTVDGQALPLQSVDAMAPGERRVVIVEGPRCQPGSSLAVDLDPSGAVDERVEVDNRLTRPCPTLS
ncbi:MAG TPA: CARDB domain-containing protein [Solirubrobacteraceae bacterium]|nr:CARDB domain-containing protein [Solirubrobacteraceae bacterium]